MFFILSSISVFTPFRNGSKHYFSKVKAGWLQICSLLFLRIALHLFQLHLTLCFPLNLQEMTWYYKTSLGVCVWVYSVPLCISSFGGTGTRICPCDDLVDGRRARQLWFPWRFGAEIGKLIALAAAWHEESGYFWLFVLNPWYWFLEVLWFCQPVSFGRKSYYNNLAIH